MSTRKAPGEELKSPRDAMRSDSLRGKLFALAVFLIAGAVWQTTEWIHNVGAAGATLTNGQVVGREDTHIWGVIPTQELTIRLAGSDVVVRARGPRAAMQALPDRVQFRYTGRLEREVFIEGERPPFLTAAWLWVVAAGLIVFHYLPLYLRPSSVVVDLEDPGRHFSHWRNYHRLYLAQLCFWAAYAVFHSSVWITVLLWLLLAGFFAEIILPLRILNQPANRLLRRPGCRYCAWLFSFHQPLNLTINAISTSLAVLALNLHPDQLFRQWYWTIPVMLVAVHTGYYHLPRGVFSLAKRAVVGRTRIVVFRRFEKAPDNKSRATILPILGAYGYLVLYSDPGLEQQQPGSLWETTDLLSGTFSHMPVGDAHWEQRIANELGRVDFAVFDWRVVPSEAMRFELEAALQALPLDRLVWIVPDALASEIREYLKTQFGIKPVPDNFISRDLTYWPMTSRVRRAMARRGISRERPTPLFSSRNPR